MSLGFQISGVDGSTSLLPTAVNVLDGFPLAGLQALYLMQDGVAGSAYTGAASDETDTHDAIEISGSAIKQIASGMHSGGDVSTDTATTGAGVNGFLFNTGIPIGGSFSFVMIAKLDEGNPAEVNPIIWMGGPPTALPPTTPAKRMYIAVNTSSATAIALRLINLNLFTDTTNSKTFSVTTTLTNRFALAMSVDVTTGIFLLRMAGQSLTFTDLAAAQWLASQGFVHCFGYARGGTSDPQVDGESDIAAFYSGGSKDAAGLDALIAAAKAKVTARGVTVPA